MAIRLNIIDESLTVEQTMQNIWKRNVFFIGFYALLMISVFIGGIFDRLYGAYLYIKGKITKTHILRVRKVHKNPKIAKWFSLMTEKFWEITLLMLFFTIMFISKMVYHIAKITWWVAKKIAWPLMWFLLAAMFVASYNNNNKKY